MKRSALGDDASTGQQPAAKSSRTGDSGTEGSSRGGSSEDNNQIFDHSTDPAAEATAAPKAMAPGIARPCDASRNGKSIRGNLKSLWCAKQEFTHWCNVVQREKMQLQAHLDLNCRERDLQLEEVRNRHGEVIGVYDREPDIDRLHIKVWFPDRETYVCFLDCRFEDTIGTLKTKIQGHRKVVHTTFSDMKVFYKGILLSDADTLDQHRIDDDCILHAGNNDIQNVVAKASAGLHQWRELPGVIDRQEASRVCSHEDFVRQWLQEAEMEE